MTGGVIENTYIYMYRCVVNLPGYGLVQLYTYYNGCVYGRVVETRFDFCMNVANGLTTEVTGVEKELIFIPDERHFIQDVSEKLGRGQYVTDLTHDVTIQLLVTLVSHRVGGDAILKGLKASIGVYNPNDSTALKEWKICEGYLGGWFISDDKGKVTVDTLLYHVYDHLMGVEG